MSGGRPSWALRTNTDRLEALAALLVGAVVAAVAGTLLDTPAFALLLGWDTVAAVYIGWLTWLLRRYDAEMTRRRAMLTDLDRVVTDVTLLTAAVASLVAVAFVLAGAGRTGGVGELARVVLGVASVGLSWAVVHVLFTLRYAVLYYREPVGGIDFNETDAPSYRDFAYLAFTVGMTYQVSDTAVRSSHIRAHLLRHALLSFVFGTGILATTVNLVASLRG
jgi:uncharacterized membrane protein